MSGATEPALVFLGVPEPVGKYDLRAVLGQGSFGTVYLGYQRDLERAVALKELHPRFAANPGYLARFRAEAEIMARLNSPHCVRVYDFLEIGGRALLVSEFVDGASLQAVIEVSGPLTPEQALGVMKGALAGLGDANQAGLVHRDVKPANLLADRDGVSKLADFGQAYAVGSRDLPGAGVTGTPAYMSPEQVRGEVVDHRSDVYSCGAVLFELLAGRAPFVAENPAAVMNMHLESAPPDPRLLDRTLAPPVARLVQRAMAKDPGRRPGGARELLAELEAAAVKGYGADWETRASIRHLVEAAALALGLLGLGSAMLAQAGGGNAAGATTVGGTTVGSASSASTPVRPTPAAGRRLPGRPLALAAVAAALVAMVGLGTLAVTHTGPFSAVSQVQPSLVAAFGPAAFAAAVEAPSGTPVFTAGPAGSVVERVTIVSPATVPLSFAYCDAFVCGNSDNIDCIGNSYVPGFGSAVPLTMTLGPPPGSRLEKALVSAGPAPGVDTALAVFDPGGGGETPSHLLAGAPQVGSDGSLRLEFATPWRKALQPHYDAGRKRYCGFNAEQKASFTRSFGVTYSNPYPAITVLARWSPAVQAGTTSVVINGASQNAATTTAPRPPPAGPVPVLLQYDARWAGTRAGATTIGSAGTVATAVAMALTALGLRAEPPAVAQDLVRAGAWDPSRGTDWERLVGYLNQRVAAGEVDLPAASVRAQGGAISLAALTDSSSGSPHEAMVVVTGYDPARDSFRVIDPRGGADTWGWDRIAAANPWLIALDRKAPL
ncbi:MAG: hypothetical protein NVS3B24_11900 [Candidatus Dormibacteria bacterium]